jgi:hypothetical protein
MIHLDRNMKQIQYTVTSVYLYLEFVVLTAIIILYTSGIHTPGGKLKDTHTVFSFRKVGYTRYDVPYLVE